MSYTLDTSAILAYFLDEPGSDDVKEILKQSENGEGEVFVSFMTFMEVLYRIWKSNGEHQAKKTYLLLRGLPVSEIGQSENLLVTAARLKAHYPISVADAWIAATALSTDSTLVHKDPEMESLADKITTKALPYKS
jgi:predicted nucleic acid-binding protein